jgi:long-chain acyl-CoA synthetase
MSANGTGNGHAPPPAASIDVAQILDGKQILLIGTTGFVGKVALSMLLRRYPNVGKVYALVRPGMGNTADERFFRKVAGSPAFDPLREVWGDGYEEFMRAKVAPIPGDIGRPRCNFDDELMARFEREGGVDVIINSAGLVSFMPSLESALRINAGGARNVLDAARELDAALVHVSTCYVAGKRDGEVWEDEEVLGYFPRQDELRDGDFSAEAEMADCQRIVDQVRERSNDRAHISEFRERAAASLRQQRRDPDDEATLRLAVARERKIWLATKLTELGMERSLHWGWTNTYTYTKSLGEQVILADDTVRSTIVRPAIVESAVRYPFPGWNEGYNTTAPMVYLVLKGHRQVAAGHRTPIDVIPVDYIAAGMLMATAAVLAGEHDKVYQFGTSDSNPVTTERLIELTGLEVRKMHKARADAGENVLQNRLRARMEAYPVSFDEFERSTVPRLKRWSHKLTEEIDRRVPTWGAPRLQAWAERAKDELGKVSAFTQQVTDVIELFRPFTHDHNIVFRCDNIRRLHARLTPQDQMALPWDPEHIDWRVYWKTHFEGLQEWVFPVLDDEFGAKPRSVYTYKDLLELFDAAAKLHRHRIALRLLPGKEAGEDAPPVVYTYERIQDMALQGAGSLRQRGIEAGDRVMLMSENRPEWGISYFAVLRAGATVVPLDNGLSLAEVANLARSSGAKVFVLSERTARRLLEDEDVPVPDNGAHPVVARLLEADGVQIDLVRFDDLLVEPEVSPGALVPSRRGDSVASIIYTSGTTGAPKGVMLTDKNLTSMAAKLSQLFKLYRHDGLLSVLPLHHTFEFSAGFLMPLVHGSSITYLEEIDADALSDAFAGGGITGMVGVPALWQLLHRKIFKAVAERGPLVQRGFEAIVDLNRNLRERIPYDWNLGKLLFYPVHRRLGGRIRLMISGGSALSPDLLQSYQGLGFRMFEGYGMTEAAPVITVMRPDEKPVVGSVGRALPGVDVQIHEPDEQGVGEVIAKGPNVMKGYHDNPDATRSVLRDGWLHTGDLGRLDDDGNLYIVGRKKDMILGPSGENVYPDELEELYGDSEFVKELSIVGLPGEAGAETVAALVVPDYEQDDLDREAVRETVREHMRATSHRLPLYKRVKVFHLWDHDLPRTSTRKVKRPEIVAELERLERAAGGAAEARKQDEGAGDWIREVIARVCQKPKSGLTGASRLEALGFDSLMFTELGVALEAAGVTLADPAALNALETVGDVEQHVAEHGVRDAAERRRVGKQRDEAAESDEIEVSESAVKLGRKVLRFGQRMTYERVFDTRVTGKAYIPPFGGYIVAANHASHLDMGLVKHALGEQGEALVALAAKDYFFEDPVRRAYFENFTNLVPMERYGSLRESLRLAGEIIREGYILLIFPEGTRSETGIMTDFKPSLGYLAMSNRCGILPMYLAGCHDALPKGSFVPKQRDIAAHVGPFQRYEALAAMAEGHARSEAYRGIATHVEGIVRRLAPSSYEWTLGEAGRRPVAEVEAARAATGAGGEVAVAAPHDSEVRS